MCHYCKNPGHVSRNCRKLQNKNRRFQFVHYQKSLKSASTSITTLVESGKTNTCFISSFSTWVINSGATDRMTCNSSLFIMFQSHPSTSFVALADGLTSFVLGLGTIHLTSLITLTSVLCLPDFSFNLISTSKLTRTLNCSISYFFLIIVLFKIFRLRRLLVEDESLGVSTSLKHRFHSLLLVLELLPHSNYIVAWVIILSLC